MNIGQAAARSGVIANMIRDYELIDFVRSASRQASNHRSYNIEDVSRLQFVCRGRDLGFSIDRIRDLLKLWGARSRCS